MPILISIFSIKALICLLSYVMSSGKKETQWIDLYGNPMYILPYIEIWEA